MSAATLPTQAPSLRVVKQTYETRSGVITIWSPTQEGVLDVNAKNMAVQAGSARLGICGLDGVPSPYPVDENGVCDDDLLLGRRGTVAGYQADYIVNAKA